MYSVRLLSAANRVVKIHCQGAIKAALSKQELRDYVKQYGYIIIPGSSNPDHIAKNYDIFDFDFQKQRWIRYSALMNREGMSIGDYGYNG